MKFLKNIAIAALVTTAFSGTVMAAAPDLLLVANGGPTKSKLTLTTDAFERVQTKAAFGKTSDVAVEIAERVVAAVVAQVMAIDAVTYDDAGKVVALVKAKNANAEQDIAFGAKLKLAGADASEVTEAVDGLVAKIVAKLGLKDKDEAAIEAISQPSAEWDVIKDFDIGGGQTLAKLAAKPKTAKGVKIGGHELSAIAADLKAFAAHVAHQKVIAERDGHLAKVGEHEVTIKAHLKTIGERDAEIERLGKLPKTNPAHEAAFDVLAQFEQDIEDNGFDASTFPGYVKGKTAENIEAFFQLNVKLAASVDRLTKQLAAAIKERDEARSAPAASGGGRPGGIPSFGGRRGSDASVHSDGNGTDDDDAFGGAGSSSGAPSAAQQEEAAEKQRKSGNRGGRSAAAKPSMTESQLRHKVDNEGADEFELRATHDIR